VVVAWHTGKGYANLSFGRFVILMADKQLLVSPVAVPIVRYVDKKPMEQQCGVDFFNRNNIASD